MYCKKCGNEISDEAVICPKCGYSKGNYGREIQKEIKLKTYEPANGILLFLTFIIPIVGLILGIVDISRGKKASGKLYLKSWGWNLALCIVSIWIRVAYLSVPVGTDPPLLVQVLYIVYFALCIISVILVISWFKEDKVEYNKYLCIEKYKNKH